MTTSPYLSEHVDPAVFERIGGLAHATDQQAIWPKNQLQWIAEAGVMAWEIPESLGGRSVPTSEMTRFYLDCSAACLTTAFVLSQRNAAVSRLLATENADLQARLLPRLASGECFATVGISHLSTSRQHLQHPAVTVQETSTGWLLNGNVPWITGGEHADWLVTGGTLADGRQILVALDTTTPGLRWGSAEKMLALNASATVHLEFTNLEIPAADLILGPQENVMKSGGGGTGSVTTSTLALGVAGRAVQALAAEAERRENLLPESQQLTAEWQQVVSELLATEASPGELQPLMTQTLRSRANSLVLRSSQALLTAAKGAGFLSGHIAERTVREAMFFLVWSCPQPVAQAALKEFACTPNWQ